MEPNSNGISYWNGFSAAKESNKRPGEDRDSIISGSKRMRLSDINAQEEDANDSDRGRSPLGLTLRITPSFINSLEMMLSRERKKADQDTSRAKMEYEKLKASNFTASLLRIGTWEKISINEGDLIAKCYYAKKKIVWEVLEGALKRKIEIQWSEIVGIKAVLGDNEPGMLEIELDREPSYFHETNPQPRKHTLWQSSEDFTGGQARIYRRHYVVFPKGVLDKHYEKLLQCDQRLFNLSKKPFPTLNNPFFDPIFFSYSEFSSNLKGNTKFTPIEHPPLNNIHEMQYFQTIPIPQNVHTHVVPLQSFKATANSPIGVVDPTSRMSVMDFPNLDDMARNCTVQNQRNIHWGNQSFPVQDFHGQSLTDNTREESSMTMESLENEGFTVQDFNLLNSVEELGLNFKEIENLLMADSQFVHSDESKHVLGVRSANSLLQLKEMNLDTNNIIANQMVNEHENFDRIHNAPDTLKYSVERCGIVLNPASFSPPQDSNVNMMMMNPPRNQLSYPYGASEPTPEDFAALDASQEIRHWG